MTRRSVQRAMLLAGTILVLSAIFVALETRYHFIVRCAYIPWFVRICVVVLTVLCALFLLVTYKKAALIRQAGQEIRREAEQLFVGDCRGPRSEDAMMLDKASILQMDQQDLFKTALN